MARLSPEETTALLERFRRYLKDHHLPVTRQRDVIARVVLMSDDHLSVEGIERELARRHERIGTATVYRALDTLVKSGVVRAHNFGEGFKRYEPVAPETQHEHLVCVRCAKVVEFASERLERMLPIIADEHQFLHQRHRVEIYGLCRDCRQRDVGGLVAS